LYIIVKGAVEVVREEGHGEAVLARLGPGEYFGEMALLARTTRNATVRALETTDLLSLPQGEFSMLAAHLPELRRGFEKVAEQRRSPAAVAS
jgi:CRP-like cAMP-binding protein